MGYALKGHRVAYIDKFNYGGRYEYYSISPQYDYPPPDYTPRLIGYVRNVHTLAENQLVSRVQDYKNSGTTPNWAFVQRTGIGMQANLFERWQIHTHRSIVSRRLYDKIDKITYYETGYEDDYPVYHSASLEAGLTDREQEGAQIDAIRECLEQMKDQKVNLLQALAERQRTADTIADTIIALAKTITSIRKGDVQGALDGMGIKSKRARKRLKVDFNSAGNSVADKWLALQYGWKPLVSDIHGAAMKVAMTYYPPIRCVAKGKGKRATAKVITTPSTGYGVKTVTRKWETTCRYTVHYEIAEPILSDAASLGLTNPLYIAWELLPWSFVYDWALPIGPWLNTFDATAGLQFRYGSYVMHHTADVNSVMIQRGSNAHYDEDTTRTANIRWWSLVRTPLIGFPYMPFPQFKNPMSLSHLANAMALLKKATR